MHQSFGLTDLCMTPHYTSSSTSLSFCNLPTLPSASSFKMTREYVLLDEPISRTWVDRLLGSVVVNPARPLDEFVPNLSDDSSPRSTKDILPDICDEKVRYTDVEGIFARNKTKIQWWKHDWRIFSMQNWCTEPMMCPRYKSEC